MQLPATKAFTLAELLIALAILGVIATFTIPKILQGSTNSKYKSMAKEAAATMAEAYSVYKLNNTVATTNSAVTLAPYLNYVKSVTAGYSVQDGWGGANNCTASNPCYQLHNGGYLLLWNTDFDGTSALHATEFIFDPDGNGPVEGEWFYLYYNGRITSIGYCFPGTVSEGGVQTCPNVGGEPDWFSWS